MLETLIFPVCIVINCEDQEKLINRKLAIDCFISFGAFKVKVVLVFSVPAGHQAYPCLLHAFLFTVRPP